jgi:hypothetical protein
MLNFSFIICTYPSTTSLLPWGDPPRSALGVHPALDIQGRRRRENGKRGPRREGGLADANIMHRGREAKRSRSSESCEELVEFQFQSAHLCRTCAH